MTISAWWLLPAAIPVLWLGEFLVRRISPLRRFSIPVPVVGGLLIALVILAANLVVSTTKTEVVLPPLPSASLPDNEAAAFAEPPTTAVTPPPAPQVVTKVVPALSLNTRVTDKWWMWLTTPEITLGSRKDMPLTEPLVVAFFTCIGLNASWALARKGGLPLIIFLVISSVLCVAQNVLGVGLCKAMDQNPLMGVLCGGVALTGGPGTAMGMSQTFVNAGFKEAAVVGLSAATFGLVGGSLLGGPIAALLIKWKKLPVPGAHRKALPASRGFDVFPPAVEGNARQILQGDLPGETRSERDATATAAGDGEGFGLAPAGFVAETLALGRFGKSLVIHVVIILACLKLGSWVSYFMGSLQIGGQKVTFPVYMGAMVLGILVRNVVDLVRPGAESVIKADVVEGLASILLALFLTVTMVSLNLMDLRSVAGPMLVLLVAQMLLMAAFAVFVTFPLMGRTYDAAVLTAGQIGFGLGATSNAVATMEATTRRFGPSPKSFLIVTIVGGFLIDVINALVTMGFLQVLK